MKRIIKCERPTKAKKKKKITFESDIINPQKIKHFKGLVKINK